MRQDIGSLALNEESLISARSIKRSTGSYYTPPCLASQISSDTIHAWLSKHADTQIRNIEDIRNLASRKKEQLLSKIENITVLDPSVGEAVFLLEAGNLLVEICESLGSSKSESELRRSIARRSLFGIDLANHAVETSLMRVKDWADVDDVPNVRLGNSLLGFVNHHSGVTDLDLELIRNTSSRRSSRYIDELDKMKPFHWGREFPRVFIGSNAGFDIILGNPPYGNILGNLERRFISISYPFITGGHRTGTWNSAAHFIVRAVSLLKDGGQLGFLVPNSVLRVKQFTKTREFLLNKTKIWKVVDEGNPFDGVTLEMISLFLEKTNGEGNQLVHVESRREGLEQSNLVELSVLKRSKVLPIYFDEIYSGILERGRKNQLTANRGRDIPKFHTRKQREPGFDIPYITSGRSVRRYHLYEKYVSYANDWVFQDSALTESYENELLVATKNYRYPRCILKPKGVVHGGGIVKISPQYHDANLRVLGLILNSRLVRNLCVRYLTNYSQLTCCLNTGIMEELPLIIPKKSRVYSILFDNLTSYYSEHVSRGSDSESVLEHVSDALVYSQYLFEDTHLEEMVEDRFASLPVGLRDPDEVLSVLDTPTLREVDKMLQNPSVRELERLCSYPASDKSLRY